MKKGLVVVAVLAASLLTAGPGIPARPATTGPGYNFTITVTVKEGDVVSEGSALSVHDRVREKIAAGVPGHAQATIGGNLVSLHPGITGLDLTYSGHVVIKRPFTGSRLGYVRGAMIDLWVRGEAQVSGWASAVTRYSPRPACSWPRRPNW